MLKVCDLEKKIQMLEFTNTPAYRAAIDVGNVLGNDLHQYKCSNSNFKSTQSSTAAFKENTLITLTLPNSLTGYYRNPSFKLDIFDKFCQ